MYSLKNKTILVTGGTGSFGKSFVRHLLENKKLKKVIVLSRDELKQYQMRKEIRGDKLRFFIGDVRDLNRLRRAFSKVDVVVHAAALKQVPTLEYNPFEAVKTNIMGTQNVIEAAIDEGVGRVLLVSTDKAAHPSNLYGSTKLCAEKLFVAANSYSSKTKFSVVRYGNVIASRGSFIETLLNNEKKVEVTDLNMTRFWISLGQTNDLMEFALRNMVGGELFVSKIPSMSIKELIDVLAPKAVIKTIGLRPGEKMHEVLITNQEARHTVDLGKHYVILPEFPFWDRNIHKKYYRDGKKLEEGFCYASNTNKSRLSASELKKIL